MLEHVGSFHFDIFGFVEACKHEELIVLPSFLMDKHNLFESLKIDPEVFFLFMRSIHDGYRNVAYHNKTHGTDVC